MTSDMMLAYVLHGPEDMRPTELPRPEPGEGQVLLRVRRAGICGSDIHYFTHGQIGRFVPKRPFVLGHEFAGEIAALGAGVEPSLLGARVAVDPSIPCGRCRQCRRGRYNLCLDMRFFGSASCDPHLDGGFAEFVAVPARSVHPLPDEISWGEAALLEPLSVAMHACMRAGPLLGRSVLVTGGGAIGLLVVMVARAAGAAPVVVSDPAPFARRTAAAIGADAALDPTSADFAAEASAHSEGGFEVAFEASGVPRALAQAVALAERGATIVQVGTLPAEVTLPLNDIMARELTLAGSFRFANVFDAALRLLAMRRIDVKPLVSKVLSLERMNEAMAMAVAKDGVVKVQVEQ
jgi:L-idonate 5-dehydrogenase